MDSAAILESVVAAFDETLPPEVGPQVVTCMVEEVLLPEHIRGYLDEEGNLTTTHKADERDLRVLRAKHHSVARLLAEGVPEVVVAQITGYTQSYISTLKKAPAMIQLVEHYRAPGNAAAKHLGENLRRIAGMSLEVLEDRLEKEADKVTTTELTQLAKLGLDRSGHGPQSQVHNVTEHHIIDHAEIERRHLEARRRDRELVVDPETVREAVQKQLPAPKDADDVAADD